MPAITLTYPDGLILHLSSPGSYHDPALRPFWHAQLSDPDVYGSAIGDAPQTAVDNALRALERKRAEWRAVRDAIHRPTGLIPELDGLGDFLEL